MRVRRGEGGAARGDSGWSLQGRERGKGRRREARRSPRRCLQGRGLARGHRFPQLRGEAVGPGSTSWGVRCGPQRVRPRWALLPRPPEIQRLYLMHETKHKWWSCGWGEVGREPCAYVLNYFPLRNFLF